MVLFLVEGPDDLKQGVNVPVDEPGEDATAEGCKAFLRYALKMATGSGNGCRKRPICRLLIKAVRRHWISDRLLTAFIGR